jgi:hypothetical protein
LESPQTLLLKKREGEIEKNKNKGHPPSHSLRVLDFWAIFKITKMDKISVGHHI